MSEFSFPYPKIGKIIRKPGEGCSSCVHNTSCPAMYWFRRGHDKNAVRMQPIDDKNIGTACLSWSNDRADIVTEYTQRDLDEVEYIWQQGTGAEAN